MLITSREAAFVSGSFNISRHAFSDAHISPGLAVVDFTHEYIVNITSSYSSYFERDYSAHAKRGETRYFLADRIVTVEYRASYKIIFHARRLHRFQHKQAGVALHFCHDKLILLGLYFENGGFAYSCWFSLYFLQVKSSSLEHACRHNSAIIFTGRNRLFRLLMRGIIIDYLSDIKRHRLS